MLLTRFDSSKTICLCLQTEILSSCLGYRSVGGPVAQSFRQQTEESNSDTLAPVRMPWRIVDPAFGRAHNTRHRSRVCHIRWETRVC